MGVETEMSEADMAAIEAHLKAKPLAAAPRGTSPTFTEAELAQKAALLNKMRPKPKEKKAGAQADDDEEILHVDFIASVRLNFVENNYLNAAKHDCELTFHPKGVLIESKGKRILVPSANIRWMELA